MGRLAERISAGKRKACSKCRAVKVFAEFYIVMKNKDRRDSWCRACRRATSKGWRKDNPGAWAEQMRRYRARKAGRELCPCCGRYSLKASSLSPRQAEALKAARAVAFAGAELVYCRKCGAEHAKGGACPTLYKRCAVPGCGRGVLPGDEAGRCIGCTRENKTVSRPAKENIAAPLRGARCPDCRGSRKVGGYDGYTDPLRPCPRCAPGDHERLPGGQGLAGMDLAKLEPRVFAALRAKAVRNADVVRACEPRAPGWVVLGAAERLPCPVCDASGCPTCDPVPARGAGRQRRAVLRHGEGVVEEITE